MMEQIFIRLRATKERKMKKFILFSILLIGSYVFAQSASPTPAPAASSGFVTWLESNWGMICSFLLALSEGLGFTKLGGILNAVFGVLKSLGSNTPSGS
jgi:hypothetical protein